MSQLKNLKVQTAKDFVESFSNNQYYMFVGDHTDHSNSAVANVNASESSVFYNPHQNMIFGKKIAQNSVAVTIKNYSYESNTVYTMYDDQIDLENEQFYVVVNADSYSHVYKCLDNNNNAPSTVEPNFADIFAGNTVLYQTADGYRWKYMYSVSSADVSKKATADYFPVVANNDVSNNTVAGAIDVIKVNNGGKHYNNYFSGTFKVGDINPSGNTYLYNLSGNVHTTNGYYIGCMMYVKSGVAVS